MRKAKQKSTEKLEEFLSELWQKYIYIKKLQYR